MRKIFVGTLGLALAACGGSDTGTIETEDGTVEYSSDGTTFEARTTNDDGSEATVTSRAGGDVDLPDGFTAYPGATIVSNTSVNASDGSGSMVMMTTGDSVEDVLAHYRAEAEAAGIAINAEMNSNGNRMIAGEGEDGMTFMVNANEQDGETSIMLTVGRGAL